MKKTDIAVISFTYRGAELAERIQEAMDAVWFCKLYTKCSDARAEGIGISVDQPESTVELRIYLRRPFLQ